MHSRADPRGAYYFFSSYYPPHTAVRSLLEPGERLVAAQPLGVMLGWRFGLLGAFLPFPGRRSIATSLERYHHITPLWPPDGSSAAASSRRRPFKSLSALELL